MNLTCIIDEQRTVLHDAIADVDNTQQAHRKGLTRNHCKM